LKRYIDLLSELADIKLFFIRYAANFILLVEILYLPYVLSPEIYSSLELLKNGIILVPLVLFGINSGYINLYYRSKKDYRRSLVLISVMISIIVGFFSYIWFNNILLSIALMLYLFIMGVEKVLIVDGRLILASLYKAFFSVVLIVFIFFVSIVTTKEAESIYLLSIIIGSSVWVLITVRTYIYNIASIQIHDFFNISVFNNYLALVKEGVYISSQSMALIAFFLFDRWFISKYYPDSLNEYSISFSFSQVIFVALNTIAFSMQKTLGEAMGSHRKETICRLLKINSFFFVVLLFGLGWLVHYVAKVNFFGGYGDFFNSFMIISLFYGSYYMLSTYTVIGFYAGYTKLFLVYIVLALVFDVALSYWINYIDIGYYYFLLKSGVILLLLSGVIFLRVLKSVRI
jgi:O-antigen/teichoic acid export membrane protein